MDTAAVLAPLAVRILAPAILFGLIVWLVWRAGVTSGERRQNERELRARLEAARTARAIETEVASGDAGENRKELERW